MEKHTHGYIQRKYDLANFVLKEKKIWLSLSRGCCTLVKRKLQNWKCKKISIACEKINSSFLF